MLGFGGFTLGQLEVAIVRLVDVIRVGGIRRRSADARHTRSRPNALTADMFRRVRWVVEGVRRRLLARVDDRTIESDANRRKRVPVNDDVVPGLRGACDTVLTQN